MEPLQFSQPTVDKALTLCRDITEWIRNVQAPWVAEYVSPGVIPFSVDHFNRSEPAASWNYAFATMAMLAAGQYFKNEMYLEIANRFGRIMRSLQIRDPEFTEHYGGIREVSAVCPFSYTRDATAAGWGFIELYRQTQNKVYLRSAELFGDWFLRRALDENGYPLTAVQFEPPFGDTSQEEHSNVEKSWNNALANCQGGCLNFMYQLYSVTKDNKWVEPMVRLADFFVDYIQQDNGFYLSLDRKTQKPLGQDYILNSLHHGNDDFGSLGLLCVYRLTGNDKYLDSVKRFLKAIWAQQRSDGFFGDYVSATPVVLNISFEAMALLDEHLFTNEVFEKAIKALFTVQKSPLESMRMRNALQEKCNSTTLVTMRANCYAVIVLLKILGGVDNYLSAKRV